MRPLETVFGDNLNYYDLNGSFLLTVLILVGIITVHKRFN